MLIVEDGSGLANAEAYCAVADADAYFAARGVAAWAVLDDTAKEAALRKGCDFLETGYRWKGERATLAQALSWPRKRFTVDGLYFCDANLPAAIVRANAELALRSLTADLAPDEGPQVNSETVGPITITYQAGGRQNPRYAAVEAMVNAYTASGGAISVVRS